MESITASEHMFISPILSVSSSSPFAQVSVLALILTDYPLKIKIFGPSFVDFLQRGESYAIHRTHQGAAQRRRRQAAAGRAGYPCCPDRLVRLRIGQRAHPGRMPHPAGEILRRRYELYLRCQRHPPAIPQAACLPITHQKGPPLQEAPFAYHGLVRMGDAARFLVFSGKCAQIL